MQIASYGFWHDDCDYLGVADADMDSHRSRDIIIHVSGNGRTVPLRGHAVGNEAVLLSNSLNHFNEKRRGKENADEFIKGFVCWIVFLYHVL